MKKIISIIALLLTITLTGCSEEKIDISGKYILTEIVYEDQSITKDDDLWYTITYDQEAYIELDSEDNATINIFGESKEGKYELVDDIVTTTVDDDSQDYIYEEGKLTATTSDMTFIFEK